MDRKLLYKSNLMGNSVMRKTRAVKANNDRSTKRKELFSRGRDLGVSPETETTSTKMQSKNSIDLVKKKEAYKARFMVYMEEKKKRLAMEKANKKPPFLSAGTSTSGTRQDHEFTVPKSIKKLGSTKKAAIVPRSNQKAATCSTALHVQAKRPPEQSASTTKITSVRNNKDNPKIKIKDLSVRNNKDNSKIKTKNLKVTIPNQVSVDKQTPLMKEKLSVFNNLGIALTSTARKISADECTELSGDFEDILSPIEAEGIVPLEISDCVTIEPEEIEPAIPPENRPAAVDFTKTPSPKQNTAEQEHFYVSPFVTTSRGKVSARKERMNRDSVYKLDLNSTFEEPIDVRRRRETVKYFRKVLSEEIERLHNVCNTWELYKQENVEQIEESCLDMINVALGQTRLLMSGKFKTFGKLIDDCEILVNAILPADLEGYWGIVKLQIENVDRRFENLTIWKNNYWVDPYEKPKPKKNRLAKPLKARKGNRKLNPEEEVKSLLKKARKDFLKNKMNQPETDQCVIFVTKRKQSNINEKNLRTPPNRNKFETGAARQIKTPYRVSSLSKENRTPTINTPSNRRLTILKNAGTDKRCHRRLSLSETPRSSSSSRKSILKSETKQSNKKSVLFSEKVQYKSPDSFQTINSLNDIEQSNELDESCRIIRLRTREVYMNNLDISD